MAKEEKGLVCPNCHCKHNRVTNTYSEEYTIRGRRRAQIRRRRVCMHCGTPFHSIEKLEVEDPIITALPKEDKKDKNSSEDDNPYLK